MICPNQCFGEFQSVSKTKMCDERCDLNNNQIAYKLTECDDDKERRYTVILNDNNRCARPIQFITDNDNQHTLHTHSVT